MSAGLVAACCETWAAGVVGSYFGMDFFPLWGICCVFGILHLSHEPFRVLLSKKCIQKVGWSGL